MAPASAIKLLTSEHTSLGTQWWTDYQVENLAAYNTSWIETEHTSAQPVSYTIGSKRGNRTDFQQMISTCHGAGVKVIADTIWNHMAGVASGKASPCRLAQHCSEIFALDI
jgi:hypothetical protein